MSQISAPSVAQVLTADRERDLLATLGIAMDMIEAWIVPDELSRSMQRSYQADRKRLGDMKKRLCIQR